MTSDPPNSVEVFYSYAHEDERLRDQLKKHLSNLKRQGVITDWYDRDISAGKEWNDEIKRHLNSAKVILLLISPDFMDSDYINDVELTRAMERHEAGEAHVIPVILRPVDWQGAPFSKLQGLPTEAKPVTSWEDRDEAFLDITKGIRRAIQELVGPATSIPAVPDIPRPPKVGFVSRRDQDGRDIVERLRAELAPENNQLVVLWGAGGVGKTTLAAEAVRLLAESQGQRVFWISADGRPHFGFSTLLDDIAEQLGQPALRPLAIGPKEEALRTIINARPTVIVLDNLETIAPEEGLICKEFLAKRVHCPALITTRERIENAYLIPVAAMTPEEAEQMLGRLILQSPDPHIYKVFDVRRIFQTAEYNPLIIQWIVAQIDLAQNPDDVLNELAHGEGDAAARVFDRSYNLPQLNDGGRAVLLALALFTPSAGRPILAAVAGMDLGRRRDKERFKKAQEMLASLWLITKMDGGRRLAVAGLTRELTKSHLTADPRGRTFPQRFVSRFLQYAESHAKSTREDYDALQFERDNLLGAADVAFTVADWRSVLRFASTLAGPVNGMLSVRGFWDDARRMGRMALSASEASESESHFGVWLHNLGIMSQNRGEVDEALQLYQESLAVSEKLGNRNTIASTLHQLARLASEQGDFEHARKRYAESLRIKQEVGNESGIALTTWGLGNIALDRGELEEARELFQSSLETFRKLKDVANIAGVLYQLAILAQIQGENDLALLLSEESLAINRELGNQRAISIELCALGFLARERGDVNKARQLYNESLEITKKLGDQSTFAFTLHQLGALHFSEEDYETAEKLMQESLLIFRKLGDKQNSAECLESIGKLRIAQGRLEEALPLLNEALEIAKQLGIQFRTASVKHSLASLGEKLGTNAQAAQLLREALEIFEKLRSPKAEVVRRDLGRIGIESF